MMQVVPRWKVVFIFSIKDKDEGWDNITIYINDNFYFNVLRKASEIGLDQSVVAINITLVET